MNQDDLFPLFLLLSICPANTLSWCRWPTRGQLPLSDISLLVNGVRLLYVACFSKELYVPHIYPFTHLQAEGRGCYARHQPALPEQRLAQGHFDMARRSWIQNLQPFDNGAKPLPSCITRTTFLLHTLAYNTTFCLPKLLYSCSVSKLW